MTDKNKLVANMNKAREAKLAGKKRNPDDKNAPGVKKRTMAGSRLRWLFKTCSEYGIVKFTERFSDGSYVEFIIGEAPDFPKEDLEMGPESLDRKRAEDWSSAP